MKHRASVIFTTYNQPEWLRKALWGYECQTEKDFEIIIADDGSGQETKDVIKEFQSNSNLTIKHIWHPDEGYQKCPILNKAIIASESNYLIFTDGDCITRKDFISTHLKYAEQGYFLSGGTLRLPINLSRELTKEDVAEQNIFSLKWLYKNGLKRSSKSLKLVKHKWFTSFMNFITPTNASWNGHNASGWRKDIFAVNGFNEDMHYGGQDREFGERMQNYGIKSKQIRYSAVCVHLEHGRPYKTKESIKKNREIRNYVKNKKIIETHNGINNHLNKATQ